MVDFGKVSSTAMQLQGISKSAMPLNEPLPGDSGNDPERRACPWSSVSAAWYCCQIGNQHHARGGGFSCLAFFSLTRGKVILIYALPAGERIDRACPRSAMGLRRADALSSMVTHRALVLKMQIFREGPHVDMFSLKGKTAPWPAGRAGSVRASRWRWARPGPSSA